MAKPKSTGEKKGPPRMGGEFRSGPVAGTAVVSGVTFAQKGLQYADVEGLAIFEGDIVLGTVAQMAEADASGGPVLQSVGITGQQFRWPNARVPYEIDPAFPNPQRVTDAIAHWEANTRIRFVLRTAANTAQFPDYVRFQTGNGCSSQVGRQGGRQIITLGTGCGTGNAIHEIGHTVGLWHEQSREDRDTFVQIVWANIDPAMQHNFLQHIADGDDLGAYDYGSVMHYPPNAFSINGQATIIARQPLPPGVVMGQRNGLSAGDIAGVHMMYPATLPTRKEVAKDPITDVPPPTIKEIRKDLIKDIRKDPISDPTFKEIRKDPIRDVIVRPGPGGLPLGGAFDAGGGALPYVIASPSRAGSGYADPSAEADAYVQQLADALSVLEQQLAQLMAGYDEAAQLLDAIQKGQL